MLFISAVILTVSVLLVVVASLPLLLSLTKPVEPAHLDEPLNTKKKPPKTTKVLISAGFGDFSLSKEVVKRLVERGHQPSIEYMDLVKYAKENHGTDIEAGPHLPDQRRADPVLIDVVESIGLEQAAHYDDTELKIIEVPADAKWYIATPDMGAESIHESHRIWE